MSFPEIARDLEKLTLSGSFLPRKLAGLYLDDSYRELRELCAVEEVRGLVVNIEAEGGQQKLTLKSGEVYHSHFTVLATGNLDNTLYQELLGYNGYFPYHYSDEAGIRALVKEWKSPELRVLVLGTRLGGIDATLFLRHLLKNHESVKHYRITMASRQAQLPMVRIP